MFGTRAFNHECAAMRAEQTNRVGEEEYGVLGEDEEPGVGFAAGAFVGRPTGKADGD